MMLRHTLRRLGPQRPKDAFMSVFNKDWTPPYNTETGFPTVITQNTLQEFIPNQKVMEFAAKSRISSPNVLRRVAGQGPDDLPLRVMACNRHVFSLYHLKYLGLFEHPLTEKILHHYTEQKKSRPLWCYVQGSSAADGSNAVVRKASERMASKALIHAFNAIGYDITGKRLDGTKPELRGTVRISIQQPKALLKMEFDQLREYFDKVLAKGILPRLNPPPKPPRN